MSDSVPRYADHDQHRLASDSDLTPAQLYIATAKALIGTVDDADYRTLYDVYHRTNHREIDLTSERFFANPENERIRLRFAKAIEEADAMIVKLQTALSEVVATAKRPEEHKRLLEWVRRVFLAIETTNVTGPGDVIFNYTSPNAKHVETFLVAINYWKSQLSGVKLIAELDPNWRHSTPQKVRAPELNGRIWNTCRLADGRSDEEGLLVRAWMKQLGYPFEEETKPPITLLNDRAWYDNVLDKFEMLARREGPLAKDGKILDCEEIGSFANSIQHRPVRAACYPPPSHTDSPDSHAPPASHAHLHPGDARSQRRSRSRSISNPFRRRQSPPPPPYSSSHAPSLGHGHRRGREGEQRLFTYRQIQLYGLDPSLALEPSGQP